jgi:hypothetical protein
LSRFLKGKADLRNKIAEKASQDLTKEKKTLRYLEIKKHTLLLVILFYAFYPLRKAKTWNSSAKRNLAKMINVVLTMELDVEVCRDIAKQSETNGSKSRSRGAFGINCKTPIFQF